MKPIIAASFACLILSASAFAQQPPPPEAPTRPDRPPPPDRADPDQPRPPGPAKSARFRLRVGRVALGLTCPDDESLKACSDFAMQLLDKAMAMDKTDRD